MIRPLNLDEVPIGAVVRFKGQNNWRSTIAGVQFVLIVNNCPLKFSPQDALEMLEFCDPASQEWKPFGMEEVAEMKPTIQQEQIEALRKSEQAIEAFLGSISAESDNYVGGIERIKLEEAMTECRRLTRGVEETAQ